MSTMELKNDEFVSVSVRIRPLLSQDNTTSSCLQVISDQPPVLVVLDRSQTYNFDNIFTEDVDQVSVYNETVKPLVTKVKNGYNSTIFAYGQTGTGKTYTMGTCSQVRNDKDRGLIPRTLLEFFNCENEPEIYVSFIEIYNEKVYDLLQNKKVPLQVKGFNIQGVSKEMVFSSRDGEHFLNMGNKNRHTAETKQNVNSSRSHAIFTIYCSVKHRDHETSAKLNLVDLAGSESIKKTGNQGNTFHEGININKGLLYIGQVIAALSTNSNFVPYRQSMITTILQDSLNKKNFVSLIACVNSNSNDVNETIQTLEFAYRVKKMKNKPEVNEIISQYKKDNPLLFSATRTGGTPFKRPISTPFITPSVKKSRKMPLEAIQEPFINDSSKSLLTNSVSSINDVTQQTLSPVIRKYMSQMELSLMNKLETMFTRRSTRNSLLGRTENKENTPSTTWNKLQNEVSRLVKTEIAQLTATRATSSPLDGEAAMIRRVLTYESPDIAISSHEIKNNDEHVFKVPNLPFKNKRETFSPIKVDGEPLKVRRSTRLSMKRTVMNETISLNRSTNENIPKKGRKQNKENHNNNNLEFSNFFEEYSSEDSPVVQISSTKKQPRRSMRLSVRKPLNETKKSLKQSKNDSPFTAHRKQVLNVLNKGTVRDLEKLHSIGTKTAEQISLYRQLKGCFKEIDELSLVPGWKGKRLDRFKSANFLKKD